MEVEDDFSLVQSTQKFTANQFARHGPSVQMDQSTEGVAQAHNSVALAAAGRSLFIEAVGAEEQVAAAQHNER